MIILRRLFSKKDGDKKSNKTRNSLISGAGLIGAGILGNRYADRSDRKIFNKYNPNDKIKVYRPLLGGNAKQKIEDDFKVSKFNTDAKIYNKYREKSFSNYGIGPHHSLKEDSEKFDKDIKLHRKWDRTVNTILTGTGSATIGAIGGGLAGISIGKGKKGAAIGATASSLAGLGARKLYRKVKNSKEKEDNEDNEVSQKFSKLKNSTDRFNVGIGLKNELPTEGHKAYKKVVDRITQGRKNKSKDK